MSRSLGVISPTVGLGLLAFFDPGFSEVKNFAPTILMVFLVLWATIKLAPTWKEVKMRELDIREKEVAQREQSAIALQSMAETTRDIAIEQKHSSEALRIAERVSIREGDKLNATAQEVRDSMHGVSARVEAVELAIAAGAKS